MSLLDENIYFFKTLYYRLETICMEGSNIAVN